MNPRLLAAAALAGAAAVAVPALAADLFIEVHGVRSDDGRLYVAVHAPESKDTFPEGTGSIAAIQRHAHTGTLRFVLREPVPGRYAVNAYHDENGNGELDTTSSASRRKATASPTIRTRRSGLQISTRPRWTSATRLPSPP